MTPLKKFLYEVGYVVQFWVVATIAVFIAHYVFPEMGVQQIIFGILVVWIANLKVELKIEREKNNREAA